MAKRQPLSFSKPKGEAGALDALDERPDVVTKALKEASNETGDPANMDAKPKKEQRSREGMVSTSVWMSKEARTELKIFCHRNDEGMEAFILRAMNKLLVDEGADFEIK